MGGYYGEVHDHTFPSRNNGFLHLRVVPVAFTSRKYRSNAVSLVVKTVLTIVKVEKFYAAQLSREVWREL